MTLEKFVDESDDLRDAELVASLYGLNVEYLGEGKADVYTYDGRLVGTAEAKADHSCDFVYVSDETEYTRHFQCAEAMSVWLEDFVMWWEE